MNTMKTYDDVLLQPKRSVVESRSDTDISTNVTRNIEIGKPFVSAPMDSVTGPEMAQAMADEGGVGILHRFADIGDRVEWVSSVDGTVGASVGVSGGCFDEANKLENAGADFICVDVAHAHSDYVINLIRELNRILSVDMMVGNVATQRGFIDLVHAGADAVKVGIGPGATCTTREKTGVGVPQVESVREINAKRMKHGHTDIPIIADGGISKPGDAAIALLGCHADTVMMGSVFGKCQESPSGGDVWGMASEKGNSSEYIEGDIIEREQDGYVSDVIKNYSEGLRSAISYCGGADIESAQDNALLRSVTPAAYKRNGSFAGKS